MTAEAVAAVTGSFFYRQFEKVGQGQESGKKSLLKRQQWIEGGNFDGK